MISSGEFIKVYYTIYVLITLFYLIIKSIVKSLVSHNNKKSSAGKVIRISSVVERGGTYYYLLIEGEDKIFKAHYTVSEYLPITRKGNIIEITYIDKKDGTGHISKFYNSTLYKKVICRNK